MPGPWTSSAPRGAAAASPPPAISWWPPAPARRSLQPALASPPAHAEDLGKPTQLLFKEQVGCSASKELWANNTCFSETCFFFFLRCPKAGVSEILFKDFKILRMHLLFFFWLRPWAGRSSQARDQTRVTAVTTPNLLLLLATRDLRDAHFIFIQCPTEPGPQDMAIKGKTGFSV